MKVLGISALYHDSAAALCVDGEIAAAAQEERFTRVKHDPSFPVNAIRYCLEYGNTQAIHLDAVVYYDNPLITLDRLVTNIRDLKYDNQIILETSFDTMFNKKLNVRSFAYDTLGCLGKDDKFLVTKHHIAHAASAFYPSPFDRAAIVTTDGVGEWATTTIGYGDGNEIKLLKEIRYPHSLGLLYSAFTYFCGFKVNSGDYKFMGLAPYGEPKYVNVIKEKIIDIKKDGSYQLNMDYFDFHRNTVMTNDNFDRLFNGPPRKLESEIKKREMDIAASAQSVLEEVLMLLVANAKKITGEKNLVMAGGVALNCVANGKILKSGLFDNIWIQPASGDAGGALGCALFASHAYFKYPREVKERDNQKCSYLGPSFSNGEIGDFLDSVKARYEYHESKSALYKKTAEYLAGAKIVGYFNGRMEFGPRALGARSILADPRNPQTQSRLNLKIKFRESFRPFAPSVLVEKAEDCFDLSCESPYMLLVANIKKDRREPFVLADYITGETIDMLPIVNQVRSDIPAVTHVDYSARIQTVNKQDSPDYYNLISAFEDRTGCPVLVNTSFNVRGEPIVCTPKDAWLCFMRTDMDVLVMENYLLLKEKQPVFKELTDWRRQYELD
ncbi:MAG: carbamoyltransferase [Treponema sp.]|jgi:carbamoyltransferase|nr:carbamoyltransferase [Treponema sp.]